MVSYNDGEGHQAENYPPDATFQESDNENQSECHNNIDKKSISQDSVHFAQHINNLNLYPVNFRVHRPFNKICQLLELQ